MTTLGRKRIFWLTAILALVCLLTVTAVVYGQSNSCTSTISADETLTDTLSSECTSSNRRGNNAQYYTISPDQRATVTCILILAWDNSYAGVAQVRQTDVNLVIKDRKIAILAGALPQI